MHWKLKAQIQKFSEVLPAGRNLYYLGQRCFGGLRGFSIHEKVRQSLRIIEALQKVGFSLENKISLEIGTGWSAITPLLFWLLGQRQCYTFDKVMLLRKSLIFSASLQLQEIDFNDLPGGIDLQSDRLEERKKRLEEILRSTGDAWDVLKACGIIYRAPSDATHSELPSESIDLIFSNTTLEHIPQPMIRKLLLEGKRLLKPNGLMAHLIDPSDHFAHSDPRISPINFLKYSEKEFSRYNNSFCWQNRLRTYEYKALFIDCGFRILTWDTKPNEKSLSAIKSIRLDEKFSNLPKEEICSGSICAVVQKLDN